MLVAFGQGMIVASGSPATTATRTAKQRWKTHAEGVKRMNVVRERGGKGAGGNLSSSETTNS